MKANLLGPHSRPSRVIGVALPLLVLVVMVHAAQGATTGSALGSKGAGRNAPVASGIAASSTPQAMDPGAAASPASTPSPNLSVPEQGRETTVLSPKPGAEFWTGDKTRNEVYITIDDCQNWDRVDADLETARAKGVTLTLFPAGKFIDGDLQGAARGLQKAVAYGDEIDNHTYTHTFVGKGATVAELQGDIEAQIGTVRKALNDPHYQEWFVRTPYGSGMDNPHLIRAAANDGLAIVRWSIDTKGYETGSTVKSVMANVFGGHYFRPGAIILMHDDFMDMQALPLIIDTIRAKGFEVGGPLKNILINAGTTTSSSGASSDASSAEGRRPIAPYSEIVMGREDRALV